MMKLTKTELAREIALILRHEPERLDLVMDDEGWVSLEDLSTGFDKMTPYQITLDEILEAVVGANRGRFDISEDKTTVRALVGHTTEEVRYKVIEPPSQVLFRVESRRHYGSLSEYGILPSRRKYTELFDDFGGAISDGKSRRIKTPMVISVMARQAYHDGTVFYERNGSIFVEDVEAVHLSMEEE